MNDFKIQKPYYVYILLCEKDFLYTGITTDYVRRFSEHLDNNNQNKGAKFTRKNKPKKIVALWTTDCRSNALKLEYRIKKLSKCNKIMLISDNKCFKKMFNTYLQINKYRRIKKGSYFKISH